MNLYLSIPPCSAHPPTMIRGLIFEQLRACYRHNTDKADNYRMTCFLAQRPVGRGWSFEAIKPIFKEAHDKITGKKKRKNKPKSSINPIFIHTRFHPRAIQRNHSEKSLTTLWENTYRSCLLLLSLVLKTSGNDCAAANATSRRTQSFRLPVNVAGTTISSQKFHTQEWQKRCQKRCRSLVFKFAIPFLMESRIRESNPCLF